MRRNSFCTTISRKKFMEQISVKITFCLPMLKEYTEFFGEMVKCIFDFTGWCVKKLVQSFMHTVFFGNW